MRTMADALHAACYWLIGVVACLVLTKRMPAREKV